MATAGIEATWHGLATGVKAERVLMANLDIRFWAAAGGGGIADRVRGVRGGGAAAAVRTETPRAIAGRDATRAGAQLKPTVLSKAQARRILLRAQRLDEFAPFGDGPDATRLAVEHLGYVQIDTINVIERCHHHILHTRIPGYRREHLHQAQSIDKSVFENWTHALSYVPTRDISFYIGGMKSHRLLQNPWFRSVKPEDLRKVLALIRKQGAITLRDIDDDELVEKDHAWASRKPSKRALQLAFYSGHLTVTERAGMLKTFDLMNRHFGWQRPPKAAPEREIVATCWIGRCAARGS